MLDMFDDYAAAITPPITSCCRFFSCLPCHDAIIFISHARAFRHYHDAAAMLL